jgi:hypothetical protein
MKRAAVAIVAAFAFVPANAMATPVHAVTGASSYYASSAEAPSVTNQNPAPGTRLRTFYPQFSATIQAHGAGLRQKTLHLFVDGGDVTPYSSFSGDTLSYVPRDRIAPGWHDVFLEGADSTGRTFSDSWVFESLAPDTDVDEDYAATGFGVVPSGFPTLFPGDFMHYFFIAPDDGFAFLRFCGLTQFNFVHIRFSPVFFVTVPVGFGAFSPFLNCSSPSVLFSPFGQFTNVFVPVPFAIAGPNITMPRQQRPWQFRGMQPGIRRAEVPGAFSAPAGIYRPRAPLPVMSVPHPVMIPHPVSIPHPATVSHPIHR